MYLDVAQARQLVELDVVSEDRSLPISWHLRITQVDCRSRVGFAMHALRAPPGCLQYHFDRPRGAVTSFNFDLENPIAPGQSYAVCFRNELTSHQSNAEQRNNLIAIVICPRFYYESLIGPFMNCD